MPREQGEIDEPDDEGAGDDVDEEEGQKPAPTVKKVRRLPASTGLSVLLDASVKQLDVTVSWANYIRNENKHWSRSFQKRSLPVPFVDAKLREGLMPPTPTPILSRPTSTTSGGSLFDFRARTQWAGAQRAGWFLSQPNPLLLLSADRVAEAEEPTNPGGPR